jgi:hypothetical protein
MEHILDSFTPASVLTSTSGMFSALSPTLTLLLGFLLAFWLGKMFIDWIAQAIYQNSPEGKAEASEQREKELEVEISRRKRFLKDRAEAKKYGVPLSDYN